LDIYIISSYIVICRQPFSQDKFEELLAKLIVVNDLPFTIVEAPELLDLLKYTYFSGQGPNIKPLQIPGRKKIRQTIMKLSTLNLERMGRYLRVHHVFITSSHTDTNLILEAWL
jgi:hypothetical protein